VEPLTRRVVTVRYWAALKQAAGAAEEQVEAATLAEALAAVRQRHGHRFNEVLDRCSLLVDGAQVAGRDPEQVPLTGEVDCLPPFAGG
jgi:molybdopterin converting factor small subunit